jgi:colanic acid biosynthesis glycosyl transferase WcaI
VLFPNWVDVDQIHPLHAEANRSNAFRQQLAAKVKDIDNTVALLYSGNMGAKQGLELLAPLAEAFANDDRVHFVFCGDGAFRARLEQLVAHRSNVTLLPLQPLSRLNELLNAADIHLLPQRASAADLVMPSRLSAMLSSGRPVVATAHPCTQVAQVVEGRGLAVPAENAHALYAAIQTLVEDETLRLRLGRAAREYAVQYLSKQQVLEQFERDLKAITEYV